MTIEYRTATEEQKAVIEELLAAPFPATLETIAARLDLTPLAAAQILGRDMCSFVTGDVTERFDEVGEPCTMGACHAFHSARRTRV